MIAARLPASGLTLLAMLLPVPRLFAQRAHPAESLAVQSLLRFDGRVTMQGPQGRSRELHVILRQWQIHGRQQVKVFPERGLLIVHLHSGQVTTVINGERSARKGGDFWIVPASAHMSLTVTSESALLETTAIP